MITKKTAKVLKNCIKVVLLLILALAIYQFYHYWEYTKAHPQKEYEWISYQPPPEEAKIKLTLHNGIARLVYWGLGLSILFVIFDYTEHKENHALHKYVVKAKDIMDNINPEDEDDEQK